MVSVSDTPDEKGAESDVDHGLGDIDALFVGSYEVSPSSHPAEGSFDHPAAWQDVEPFGSFDPANHFDNELENGGFIHQLSPVIGAVGKAMLDPGPALADRVQDHLGAGAVGGIRRRQVEHEQSAVSVHGNVVFATGQQQGSASAAAR